MKNYEIENMIKNNYYGLKNGDLCFIDEGRQEKGVFHIFSDGSHTIEIYKIKDNKYSCMFGGLSHIRYLIYKGYFLPYKNCTDIFINALKLYGVKVA